ncbi:PP2C family serine/threonine-protein phosphatase [Archaeoglobus neptunius]|uniref:PP2C family serine/threonine-protein phosphatase n=1 Tax=Archaeoglobus neptunius TaxID=2798580 RepID=UPI001928CF0A|nr:PP2C family serine/threonine-protein phosphatase [Archaeoglobus neptunius]
MKVTTFTFTFTGYLHAKNGEPCQDFCTHRSMDCCTAIALADGAGSANLSHIGAKISATTFVGYFVANPERIFESKDHFVERLKKNLENNARKRDISVSALSSTLVGAVNYRDSLFLLHIGDGKAILLSDEGAEILSKGVKGEFSNETYFTTSRDPQIKVVRTELSPPFSVVLMSDGASTLFFDDKEDVPAPILHRVISMMGRHTTVEIRSKLRRAIKSLPPHRRYDDVSLAILKRWR